MMAASSSRSRTETSDITSRCTASSRSINAGMTTSRPGSCLLSPTGYRERAIRRLEEFMRQQTKPFIVEIKQFRKTKTTDRKTSIWGKLDLAPDQNLPAERQPEEYSVVGDDNNRL